MGWLSPIAGAVKVQATVSDPDSGGGDGVSWAIVHTGRNGTTVLAKGVIPNGGAQAVPSAADASVLDNIMVEPGDGLHMQIGPRANYYSDTTVMNLAITELNSPGRTWNLAGDVASNIQAGNPHPDSFGNSAVWYFFAPPNLLDGELHYLPPSAAASVGAWTLSTSDTRITVGATVAGQLCIDELMNPLTGWNWAATPSVFKLCSTAGSGDALQNLSWAFLDATMDRSFGQKLVLRFACANPRLELTSEWWARPGRGPVHHALRITNQSQEVVTLQDQPSLDLSLANPAGDGAATMWTFHSDGYTPDAQGVYQNVMTAPFSRQIVTSPDGQFIPYAVLADGDRHGIYVGIEWSYCRLLAVSASNWRPGLFRLRGGNFSDFEIALNPGATFHAPPAFLGAYSGDVDDAGNSLRRYLFDYNMPAVVRADPTYPKVQWNGFGATAQSPGSWNSVEAKYYPWITDIAALGFEEAMLDVGWWNGPSSAPVLAYDPVDWSQGMLAAGNFARNAGLRFGLYWNKGEDMSNPAARNRRIADVTYLCTNYGTDMWRSDNTGGPVVAASYASVLGFYSVLDRLNADIGNFQWENCSSGGRIKDFGAMSRCVKIFMTDTYFEADVRKAFYDSSFMYPPAQLLGCLGSTDGLYRPQGPDGMKFAFRTVSMGAPEWFIDAPNGANSGNPWTQAEKTAVASSVETYKSRIRPLVRNADLYHILPRPDGVNWDGVQYYDPATGKGVTYLFKPSAGSNSRMISLRGVDPGTNYQVTFQDGTNPNGVTTGQSLMDGMLITLPGAKNSELMFLDPILTARQLWRQSQFGSIANSGEGADDNDPDHDGVCNLLEYAFQTNPKIRRRPTNPAMATERR